MSVLTKIKEHIASNSKKSTKKPSKDFLNKEITTTNIVKMTTTSKDVIDDNEYYYTTEDYFLFADLSIGKADSDTRVIKLSGEDCGLEFNYIISGDTVIIDSGDGVKYYTTKNKIKSASKKHQPDTIQIKEIYEGAAKANKENKKMARERGVARAFSDNHINQSQNNETTLFES